MRSWKTIAADAAFHGNSLKRIRKGLIRQGYSFAADELEKIVAANFRGDGRTMRGESP